MSPLTRRSFFQGAAMAASAGRVVGANDRVQVGVIGLGGRGSDHVDLYAQIPDARIVGLCDVNQAARERNQAKLAKLGGGPAKEYTDLRKMLASNEVEAVSIATPNHWHALATIWACEAGKDVYVEKPACYNIYEGYKMIEVARRTKRIVQVGMQSRSIPHKVRAVQLAQTGTIGKLYMASGICYKRRKSIGRTLPEPVPPGIDWDLFLGPAPMQPFTMNRFKYNWHWFWDTGNGDIGNQGVHEMDICRWVLGDLPLPRTTSATGGKFVYDDDQETPNTQQAAFGFDAQHPGLEITFEVRGLLTGPVAGVPVRPGNVVGNIIFGSEGWMWVDGNGFQVYKGESNEKVMDEKGSDGPGTLIHMKNFIAACASRNAKDLRAELEVGVLSASYCHMANISYRTGSRLQWEASARNFGGNAAANALVSRNYRKPFVV
jgi:predicted dehydrogenase